MEKKIRPNVYVKVFKLTNSYGYLSEEDFIRFKQKFDEKQSLYYSKDINHPCFSSFREITKEIKRVAHNAGLTANLLKTEFKTFKDHIEIKGTNLNDMNFIVSFAKVYNKETKTVSFVITKMEAYSYFTLLDVSFRIINIDNDMKNCDYTTYVYQDYHFAKQSFNRKENLDEKYIHRCIDNNNCTQ